MLSAFKLSMGEKYLAVPENLQRKNKLLLKNDTKGGDDWKKAFFVEIISDIFVISHLLK